MDVHAVAPDIAVVGLLARPGKALYMSRPSHSAVGAWAAPFV
jgi:hypothetical protein